MANDTTVYITKDSGEREQFKTGAVRDTRGGKGRYDLLSPIAVRRISQVYERGAGKYSERNWEKGMSMCRVIDSALRHLFQYLEGQRDEDHLAHAAWNCCALMHYEELIARGQLSEELDDLPRLIK